MEQCLKPQAEYHFRCIAFIVNFDLVLVGAGNRSSVLLPVADSLRVGGDDAFEDRLTTRRLTNASVRQRDLRSDCHDNDKSAYYNNVKTKPESDQRVQTFAKAKQMLDRVGKFHVNANICGSHKLGASPLDQSIGLSRCALWLPFTCWKPIPVPRPAASRSVQGRCVQASAAACC